jgi:hypothetical protein
MAALCLCLAYHCLKSRLYSCGLDNVTFFVVNPNHGTVRAAVKFRVVDCICVLFVPNPTEWQHIGDQIEIPFIFARADFVNLHSCLQ